MFAMKLKLEFILAEMGGFHSKSAHYIWNADISLRMCDQKTFAMYGKLSSC